MTAIVGVVSDTHGLLRPEALRLLAGCERIIHAGDVGKPEILAELNRLAPTDVIRGNVDHGVWARSLPETLTLSIGETRVHVLHHLGDLAIDPVAENIAVVISGHSHRPRLKTHDGTLYLNPGSVGPRRFSLPVTLARMEINSTKVQVTMIDVLNNAPLNF